MRQEDGYATISVTALMSALSVLAAGYLHLSVAEAKKSEAIASRLSTDAAMEGVLEEVIASILNKDNHYTYNRVQEIRYDGSTWHIRIEDEAEKTDINRSDMTEIRDEIAGLGWLRDIGPEFLGEIEKGRVSRETPFLSMSDLVNPMDHRELYHCVREHFTPYHSSAVASTGTAEGALPVSDGAVLRIEVRAIAPQTPRTLDVTLLFTGRRDEPVLVLDWQRYTSKADMECAT